MKSNRTFILCLAVVLFAVWPLRILSQGMVLNAGDAYIFEFTSLSYHGPAWPYDSGLFHLRFTAGSFSGYDSVRMELFPDTLTDTPLIRTSSIPVEWREDDQFSVERAVVNWTRYDPPFWPDLQGMVRLTMLTGSTELGGIGVQQVVDGSLYAQFFPIPEPSAGALLLGGAGATILLRPRRARER